MEAEFTRGEGAAPTSPWPLVVLGLLLVLELAAALSLNGGRLTYTLDDPYIHLALAENLLHGHYGLNASEASAPSSSVLWPYLLAPFTALSFVEWVPLVVNALCAALTLVVIQRSIVEALAPLDSALLRRAVVVLSVLAIPATNLVGLVFTGMEHSLQVLVAVLVVRGLAIAARGGSAPSWLFAAIVIGPLVRYENAALSLAALLWLWLAGERGRVLATALGVAASLGAFSLYLLSQGLHPLPTSVLVKSAAVAPDGGFKAAVYALYHNLSSTPGLLMSLGVVAFLAAGTNRARSAVERRTALCVALALALHLGVGRFGWYGRYEVYAWSAGLVAALYLWGARLRSQVAGQALAKTALVGVAVVGIACREYVIVLANNAFASNNVFQQHYTMHRFAVEHWGKPVAVNDLGWVAFRNDEYVLDLWGLASLEALEARREHEDQAWFAPLAERHGVRAAMIYDKWFPKLPATWRRVGELRMGGPRVTPADSVVSFYATAPEHVAEVEASLRELQAEVPSGAALVLDGGS